MKSFVKKMPLIIIAILSLAFSIAQNPPINAAAKSSNTHSQQIVLTSIPSQDGWVLESSQASNIGKTLDKTDTAFFLGDDKDKKQYVDILSFRTGVLPDNATVTNLALKIKQYGVVGKGDPISIFHGFVVEIVQGYFSIYPALQISDFQAAANAIYRPVIPALIKRTYTFDLKKLTPFVNKLQVDTGLTQIRLSFALGDNNDDFSNALLLFSGDAPSPADRPQLIINYTTP